MNSTTKRRLHVEGLESRTMLAGDALAAAEALAASPVIFGDANSDGVFDPSDLVDVFQAGKYDTGEKADWNEGDWNGDDLFDSADLIVAFQAGNYLRDNVSAKAVGHNSQQNWPDQISLPMGFEPEGIQLGKGQEFFVGGFSYSSFFGPAFGIPHPESEYAGAIYKGNLRTGEGEILVEPTENLVIAGLSYDPRTDYIYAATADAGALGGPLTGQGVSIYDGTTGDLIQRLVFGDGLVINDVLVTNKAVYATDSLSPTLYKIPLEHGGQPSSSWETIAMDGFGMIDGAFNANGLVGDFDGNDLVVVNRASGKLFHVDTESGAATEIIVEGEQDTFPTGDGLFMRGRTLYIMQNQFGTGLPGKIAVVQLSGDLTGGTFVKDIKSDDFATPTTIIGHGDSIYAVNSQAGAAIFGEPSAVQAQVVKVKK